MIPYLTDGVRSLMNHDDKCRTARYALYGAIDRLQAQADITREEVLLMIAGYAVELTSYVLNDGAKIRELCESAALDGMQAKRDFLAREAQKEPS